ncbi:hypothetical protein A6302_01714 [Methylobrevis pamukkalensis]|uniref:Uncharacterized protein n=1 Tax=Methylobrevis pamukkalensis TaxID=1439726 RepID=A0A1E3H3Q4_9HYPH|nr:hypothetical protein A6302_01714 [Methylobrevis pamukkalensis]
MRECATLLPHLRLQAFPSISSPPASVIPAQAGTHRSAGGWGRLTTGGAATAFRSRNVDLAECRVPAFAGMAKTESDDGCGEG